MESKRDRPVLSGPDWPLLIFFFFCRIEALLTMASCELESGCEHDKSRILLGWVALMQHSDNNREKHNAGIIIPQVQFTETQRDRNAKFPFCFAFRILNARLYSFHPYNVLETNLFCRVLLYIDIEKKTLFCHKHFFVCISFHPGSFGKSISINLRCRANKHGNQVPEQKCTVF